MVLRDCGDCCCSGVCPLHCVVVVVAANFSVVVSSPLKEKSKNNHQILAELSTQRLIFGLKI